MKEMTERSPANKKDLIAEHIDLHPEAVNEAIAAELKPLVREAITEETLAGISSLLNLLPAAVEQLKNDLTHPSANIRQRAYQTLLKYTLGQQTLVSDVKDDSKHISVNFNIPRPGDQEQVVDAPSDALEELKECDTCRADKPVSEFVAGSDRCTECYERLRQNVLSRFSEDTEVPQQ